MWRLVAARLTRRWSRAVTTVAAVAAAVATFAVLSSSTEVSRLEVVGTVQERSQGAYEILVRAPGGQQSQLESARDLVNGQTAAPLTGGISVAQWGQIASLSGVEVAAPVASLGFMSVPVFMRVDVTEAVDPSRRRQWIRVTPIWSADRGLSQLPSEAVGVLYVTSDEVAWPERRNDFSVDQMPYSDGRTRTLGLCDEESFTFAGEFFPVEIRDDGDEHPICWFGDVAQTMPWLGVTRIVDGGFVNDGQPSDRAELTIYTAMWLSVAAVDPASEAQLTGLNHAVNVGNYLPDEVSVRFDDALGADVVSALAATDPPIQEELWAELERLNATASAADVGRGGSALGELVAGAEVEATLQARAGDASQFYSDTIALDDTIYLDPIRFTDPTYSIDADGVLHPDVVEIGPTSSLGRLAFEYGTPAADDTGFRLPTGYTFRSSASLDVTELFAAEVVGMFERSGVTEWDEVARLPWDGFDPVGLRGADPVTRDLLGGQPLLPSSNPGGYVLGSPSILMSLADANELAVDENFISAVRVRVADGQGIDAASRERVRQVAEEIATSTGLQVDVVLGSSPAPQPVELAAGQFGRPTLLLSEPWAKKNVATTILTVIERKSLVLFTLVLVVSMLFVANVATASVRQRRSELGVLACVGWAKRPLFVVVLGELLILGVGAAVIGTAGAALAGLLPGLRVSLAQALISVPAAVAVVLVAGVMPAWSAARSDPMAAVRPAVVGGRRARLRLGVVSLSVANVLRTPGRTILSATALTISVAAATLLMAVLVAFQGTVVGTLLGDVIAVQVRGADIVAVAAMLMLAVFAVGDVIYLNITERAAEFAALQATGWNDRTVSALVVTEGMILGAIGSVAGAAFGVGATWLLVEGQNASLLVGVGAAAAFIGIALAVAAAAISTSLLRRHRTVRLLTEE